MNVILSIADFIPICILPELLPYLQSHFTLQLCRYYDERQDRERCKICILGLKEEIIPSGKLFAKCADSAKDWIAYSHSLREYLLDSKSPSTDFCTPLIRILSNLSADIQYNWAISYLGAILSSLLNSSEMDYTIYSNLLEKQNLSSLVPILKRLISALLGVYIGSTTDI